MEDREKINKVLTRVVRRYSVHEGITIKKEELADFFFSAYSDQFNAADHQNEENILKRWEWANLRNPNIQTGQSTAWFCKNNQDEKIVGHFGIIPIELKYKDLFFPASWGRDLITLPQLRNLGIGPFLVDNALKNEKKNGVFLIAGLNDFSYSIFKKFGFLDLGFIPLHIRINRLDNILAKKFGGGMWVRLAAKCGRPIIKMLYTPFNIMASMARKKSGIRIKQIWDFDDSFDKLWQNASPSFSIIGKRDKAWLNWRFVHQPYWNYKIFKAEKGKCNETRGYVILREGVSKGFRVGVISDLFAGADDKETAGSLVGFAVNYFNKKDAIDLIRCDLLHGKFVNILKKYGFVSIKSNSRFMLSNIRKDLDGDFASNRENWFVSYADSDLDLAGAREE